MSQILRVGNILLGIVLISLSTLSVGVAQASVSAPVEGSLTVTVPGSTTPITLTPGQGTPAMTYTAFGIGLSGFGNGVTLPKNIQVRPSSLTVWSDASSPKGWTPRATCPVGSNFVIENSGTATTTLSDCGISAVYINDVAVSNVQVYVEAATTNIPNTLVISSTTGNYLFNTADSVGIVRVELLANAWTLPVGAAMTQLFSLQVTSQAGSLQGKAFTFNRSVIFDSNGGSGPEYSQTAAVNARTSLIANRYTKSGYYLSEWNTSADGTGDSYSSGGSYLFDTNRRLFAQWALTTSGTITFDANTGTGSMDPQSATNISALAKNTLTKTGYTFAGWNTSADGTGTSYSDEGNFQFDGSVTLFAQWTQDSTANSKTASNSEPSHLALTGGFVGPLGLVGALFLLLGMTMVIARKVQR